MAKLGREPTAAEFNENIKRVSLEAAANAAHLGYSRIPGASGDWSVVMEDLALLAGNTPQAIEAAKKAARPKSVQLQEVLVNLQRG